MTSNQKVFPGQFLAYEHEYLIGESGVFKKENKIYSSLTGNIFLDSKTNPPTISVISQNYSYLPHINDEVYGKIIRVKKQQAECEIFATKNKIIRPFLGIIKHENVKNDYKDFDMFECFVPGDIIIGKIIAIDQSQYIYVSVSDVNKGVVFAKSKLSNELMMPVSWEFMEDLYTNVREKRKVAKPDYINS